MIETIIEVLIIAGTLVCASLQMRKDALKARRVYAIAFVLMIAVCIAFGIAQGAVAAGIFYTTLSFSPIEVLSLLAVIFMICKRFSKTGLKYYNNRRKQHKTRQFRTMTVQMPDMTF